MTRPKREPRPPAEPPTDDELDRLLRAIQAGDDANTLLDNDALVRKLGLSAAVVGHQVETAKDRRLVWGIPTGHNPTLSFTDLELTVQGRRFLSSRKAATG